MTHVSKGGSDVCGTNWDADFLQNTRSSTEALANAKPQHREKCEVAARARCSKVAFVVATVGMYAPVMIEVCPCGILVFVSIFPSLFLFSV